MINITPTVNFQVHSLAITGCQLLVSWSVKLLLVVTSTVIPGFSLLETHDQDFYSLLDMHMF
jgi:hypothetical protein